MTNALVNGWLRDGEVSRRILGSFFDVYNELGTGFLQSVYQASLIEALRATGLHVEREVGIDVYFRTAFVGKFFADLVVENRVVVEIKAVRTLAHEHEGQLIHYLRATTMEVGLLLNFGPSPQFKRKIFSNTHKRGIPR